MLKLLLVENSKSARLFMQHFLRQAGFEVSVAASGPEALTSLEANHFDLVIMDVFMPMMNGYEVTRILRAADLTRKLPIIAYTASAEESDKNLCLASGMNAVIIKSEEHHDLLHFLHNFNVDNFNVDNFNLDNLNAV